MTPGAVVFSGDMPSPTPDAVHQMRQAIEQLTPDDATGEASLRVLHAAAESSAAARPLGQRLPSPDALAAMANAISELAMTTGAHCRDFATVALAAAVVAVRIGYGDRSEFIRQVDALWDTPLPPP